MRAAALGEGDVELHAFMTEASAELVGSSGAGWLVSLVRSWGCAFVPPCQLAAEEDASAAECWLPLGCVVTLSQQLPWWRVIPGENSAESLSAASASCGCGNACLSPGARFWAGPGSL